MTGLSVGGDPWKITTEERAKHDSQFFGLKPENGFITGAQARNFFLQSGLPTPVLGQIWSLADINADGRMDRREFSIAMHLIQKKLQGVELPRSLPPSLKMDPSPGTGMAMGIIAPPTGTMVRPYASLPVLGSIAPPTYNGIYGPGPVSYTAPTAINGSMLGGLGGPVVSSSSTIPRPLVNTFPVSSSDEWAVPQSSKLKYTQMFNRNDHHKRGHLLGVEARGILVSESNLPQMMLAQIWNLADIDKDGKLTTEEFVLAMHLVDLVRTGQTLPSALPPNLVPPSYRRVKPGQAIGLPPAGLPSSPAPVSPAPVSHFSDLLGGFAAPVSSNNGTMEATDKLDKAGSMISFEDRRKENFDKGQAELDRRRQLLREQQQRLEEERIAKERAEREKLEQKRLEAERQRQQELERQMERQRQIEQQREEERRKIMEQREAARRELERQRQLEWERQRRDQLTIDKQKEQTIADELRADVAKHKLEISALDSKKIDLQAQVQKAEQSVEDISNHIGQMKQSRDFKNSNIEKVYRELQEWQTNLLVAQQERTRLERSRADTDSTDMEYEAVKSTYQHKKTQHDKLRKELEELEKQLAEKQAANRNRDNLYKDLIKEKAGLERSIDSRVNDLHSMLPSLNKKVTGPVNKTPVNHVHEPVSSSKGSKDVWSAAFDSNTSDLFSSSSSVAWGASSTSSSQDTTWNAFSSAAGADKAPKPGLTKYRGVFAFESRNPDEVSFNAGDIIWVNPDQFDAEPGWMGGIVNGQEGWFPAAYAEPVEESVQDGWANFAQGSESSIENDSSKSSLMASAGSSFTAVTGAPSPTPGKGQKAPEGLQVQAVYTWRAKKDNHLTFEKGDIILVKEQQDMWWSGLLNGKTGWFPKSYVKVISSTPSVARSQESSLVTSPTLPPVAPPPPPIAELPEDVLDLAMAMFTYQSDVPEDLNFSQGDIVAIVKREADWWTGRVNGRTGIFPANYVKPLADLEAEQNLAPGSLYQNLSTSPPPASPPANTESQSSSLYENAAEMSFSSSLYQNSDLQSARQSTISLPAQSTISEAVTPAEVQSNREIVRESGSLTLPAQSQSQPAATSQKVKTEIVRVHAPYEATGPEQLSLQLGQLIKVRKKSPSGWWEGELQARGQKRKVGWFPANYVTVLSGTGTPEPSLNQLSATPNEGDSRSATPISLPAPTTAPSLEQVVALYNYQAQHEDELTFAKASVINVLLKDDPDWWKGELNGAVGMFPSNYVTPLESAPTKSTSMNSLDGDDDERKRQNLIRELITTEEAYVADMDVVLNNFYKPIKESQLLTKDELDRIFVNLRDIRRCHIKLLNGFKVRRRQYKDGIIHTIGDLLYENIPTMSHYLRFCGCQMSAANLLNTKSEENMALKDLLKRLMMDPVTKGMTLASYLMKPMQRITRYPLLLEKLVKVTPASHPDHYYLSESLGMIRDLCRQVEQAVHDKDNSDKLEWIQKHVLWEGLAEKLTLNSPTNCLGPRMVLYTGSLIKVKSGKELVGFLFNDFLLLTQPQQSIGLVASVFSFDIKANTQFKLYKKPLFLNEVDVVKNDDSISFQIKELDGSVIALKAINIAERDAWVRKIYEASQKFKETEKRKQEKAKLDRWPSMGRVLVVVLEGINLIAMEDGKSDPYCEVSMGGQENKTPVIPKSLNPKWNTSMQFNLRNPHEDMLCLTVYDRDLFTPNDFLGRTEIKIQDILDETKDRKGPIIKRLKLYEVTTGEVIVKLDIQLYNKS